MPATDRFASITERALPPQWRVRNAGYSGMTSLHQLSVLATKIPPFVLGGGRLVLFIGQSDAVALFAPGSYWDSAPRITPIQPSRPGTTVPAPPEQMLEKGVEALLATADALGLDYGVVAAPFRDGCFDTDPVLRATYRRRRENYETYTALRRKIQTVARTAAERHGAPFLDGQALVSPQHFYDLMHLNVQGQHVFAAGLTPWLERWVTGADSSSETGRATD